MLVAIAIPIFTTQLEKSRDAVSASNLRAAYAEVVADYLATGNTSATATVTAHQTQGGWQNNQNGTLYARIDGVEKPITVNAKTASDTWTLTVDASGLVSVS